MTADLTFAQTCAAILLVTTGCAVTVAIQYASLYRREQRLTRLWRRMLAESENARCQVLGQLERGRKWR
jgi:hypothetical protein